MDDREIIVEDNDVYRMTYVTGDKIPQPGAVHFGIVRNDGALVFDPAPPVNPFFRGLIAALLMVAIGLAVWGAVALVVVITVGVGQ